VSKDKGMVPKIANEIRDVEGCRIVIERGDEMELPLGGGLNLIAPAARITIYRPDAVLRDTQREAPSDRPTFVRAIRHLFKQPDKKMSAQARQAWIDVCVRQLLHLLAFDHVTTDDQTALAPGIYTDGSAPYMYLVNTPHPREGYAELLQLDARSGAVFGPTLVDAAHLVPVHNLISQDWLRALETYQPPNRLRHDRTHVAGCLLGGAVGDALGAGVESLSLAQIRARFGPEGVRDYVPINEQLGTLSWHSQLTLFTAEGLIRASIRGREKGICDAVGVVLHAYYRWLMTQGESLNSGASFQPGRDGWLIELPALHARRGPSATILAALKGGERGTTHAPINTSKGNGAAARAAPLGLSTLTDPFQMGVEVGALTHGHPTGYLAAGYVAVAIHAVMAGASLSDALHAPLDRLAREEGSGELMSAIECALRLAHAAPATPESVEQLGRGFVAEEAVAIAAFCALQASDFEHGVRLAVNHSGDTDVTGALTGQILGAYYGKSAITARWLERLELRADIAQLADDLFFEFGEFPHAAWFAPSWDRYPGW
jgi:ADP-ribosylglycohydrolase